MNLSAFRAPAAWLPLAMSAVALAIIAWFLFRSPLNGFGRAVPVLAVQIGAILLAAALLVAGRSPTLRCLGH